MVYDSVRVAKSNRRAGNRNEMKGIESTKGAFLCDPRHDCLGCFVLAEKLGQMRNTHLHNVPWACANHAAKIMQQQLDPNWKQQERCTNTNRKSRIVERDEPPFSQLLYNVKLIEGTMCPVASTPCVTQGTSGFYLLNGTATYCYKLLQPNTQAPARVLNRLEPNSCLVIVYLHDDKGLARTSIAVLEVCNTWRSQCWKGVLKLGD